MQVTLIVLAVLVVICLFIFGVRALRRKAQEDAAPLSTYPGPLSVSFDDDKGSLP